MIHHNPPHIHWTTDGSDINLYVHDPSHQRWTHIDLKCGTVHPRVDLPPGSQQLFTSDEVEEALDSYRSWLEAGLGSSPEGPFNTDRVHEAAEIVEAVSHTTIKNATLDNMLCSDN
jgi:hypothetical protein